MYHALPLPTQPAFAKPPTELTVNTATLPFPKGTHEVIHPAQGFTVTEVAMLAVVNNPGLQIARDDAHIASAQAFAAGLLPDPQIAYDHLYPLNIGPGNQQGFDIGGNYDLNTLLTYSTQKQAAAEAAEQTNLNLLWQEWQVISQARVLFNQVMNLRQQIAIVTYYHRQALYTYEQTKQAFQRGSDGVNNADIGDVSISLSNVQTVEQQLALLRQQLVTQQYALNQLLGLTPETQLKLRQASQINKINATYLLAKLNELPQRRPDLLALQAGYRSENAVLRQQILNQFPAINLSYNRSTDTQNTKSYAFGVTVNLPIFNGNRGNIAVEQATRQKLYDDYQQRLNAADNDVHSAITQLQLLSQLLAQAQSRLQTAKILEKEAHKAFDDHKVSALDESYVQTSALTAAINVATLQEQWREQQIALQTLLGVPDGDGYVHST